VGLNPFIMDKRLQARLRAAHSYYFDDKNTNSLNQVLLTGQEGFMQPDEGERTSRVKQEAIKNLVPLYTSSKMLDLKLAFGGYHADYTRNGSFLALAGQQGHISLINWRDLSILTEFHTKELVRDVKFLQNELLFAVAQRKSLCIYDSQGQEVHNLKNHVEPQKIEFLPYHFLLVSSNNHGFIKYLDVSTGKQVAEHRFRFDHVNDMKQNPWNGVISISDSKGIISMWTPNINKPVTRVVAHNGPALSQAIDLRGQYLVSSGADNKVKIFDIRNISDPLYEYWTESPARSLDISQTGLLAVSESSKVKIWKDWQVSKQKCPYMEDKGKSSIIDFRFCPFEDFLGVGSVDSFRHVVVPGAGIANFDSLEVNPFQSKRQRQEVEVKALLDKLPPDSIVVNPHEIGTVDKAEKEVIEAEEKAEREERERKDQEKRRKNKKEDKDKKQSVHNKKTREKIQEKFRELEKDKQEIKLQNVKDIMFLNDVTADLLGLPTKKKKIE
jgi:U3 small nucleolar RNA-associated protein 7